jgi:hypothetical protein
VLRNNFATNLLAQPETKTELKRHAAGTCDPTSPSRRRCDDVIGGWQAFACNLIVHGFSTLYGFEHEWLRVIARVKHII